MRTLSLALVLLAAGCTQTAAPADPSADPSVDSTAVGPFEDETDYQRQHEDTRLALEEAIEPARASTVSACRVVPTSEQACGGPTTFSVYSVEDPDAAEVERLAERLVALDVAANRQFEWASTCMAYEPPTPALQDGRCVASE